MSEESSGGVPKSFYWIAGVALIWDLLGVGAYVSQVTMSPDVLNAMPDAERALYENVPAWATAAFAIAVNGGVLGSLLLLLRKAFATPVLIISFVGIIVQMYHSLFVVRSIEVYGPGGMIMPVMVIGIAAFLIWYSMNAKKKGWLS
ncbi:MAG: hypothetical protein O3A13_01330 [Proteobacteria bacterium]|nr:hypothetical protein [Pseudomonadota bacterium]MDA0992255.1 hypothetical protein [Pseudomonadota bacterium]